MQTTPHDSPGTRFLLPKILAKLKWVYPKWMCQMKVG